MSRGSGLGYSGFGLELEVRTVCMLFRSQGISALSRAPALKGEVDTFGFSDQQGASGSRLPIGPEALVSTTPTCHSGAWPGLSEV